MTATTAPAVPASRKETALWLLDDLVPGTTANTLSLAFRVRGGLDPRVAEAALRLLVRRFEVLRTAYTRTGAELTKHVPATVEVPLEQAALDGDGADQLTAFVARPFQPDGTLLTRALLLTGAGSALFCLALHHAIGDVRSTEVLRSAFIGFYERVRAGEHPDPGHVPAWAGPEPTEADAAFWRTAMAGFRPAALELGCERADHPEPTLVGDEVTHTLSPGATAVVRELRRSLRAPESVVLLAAYCALLAAHGAGPDLAVGCPVNTRTREAADTVGYHSNIVPVRVRVDRARGFDTLVADTRAAFLDAMAHSAVPADDVVDLVGREGTGWRNALYRHVFNYIPHSGGHREFGVAGARAELVVVENGASQFDLEFFVTSDQESITVRAVFYTGVLDRSDVELAVRRYDALLAAAGADPHAPLAGLSTWCDRDHEVIDAANATDRAIDAPTVLAAFADRVAEDPDAPALRHDGEETTYGALWAAATATAEALTDAGVGNGDVVALLLRRGPELAAGVFGTWLAGAAYMPLDPTHPEQRIAYQIEDSGAAVVLTGPGTSAPEGCRAVVAPEVDPHGAAPVDAVEVEPDDLAYVIYTSGSTGKPKGIPIRHRGLVNHITDYAERFGVAGSERPTGWLSTYSFDTSAIELMMPLTTGGSTVVLPDEARTDGELLAAAVRAEDIGFLQATPTTWRLVAPALGELVAGRTLLTGGEPLPPPLARALVDAGARLWNVYGPTESTIWATAGLVDPDRGIHVGAPVANTRVFIAGPDGEPLPVGLRGEVCVAGVGVAPGYHGRPDLTARQFGEDATHGRFYRSGDVARWRPDGGIDLRGRLDRQVKLRGNRVELSEVEAVLAAHPDVAAAAVVVVGDPHGDGVLAAFVRVPERPEAVDELWDHARAHLPAAVVPHRFTAVDAYPRTGSDKIDYQALAALAAERPTTTKAVVGGDTADELVAFLVGLWAELLEQPDLGPDCHFFANGGHSLQAAVIGQRVKAATGVRLALTDVFENPTPTALAARVRREDPAARPGT
ncbi:non-ribosomal peptide synthetase [Actinokineospora sp. 24-640]